MNTQRIDLDISKRDALTQMVTIGQGDKGGTTIEATIYDNGVLASLTGKTAMLEVRLPDGKSYVRDGNCTVSGGKITYVVDEEHVAAVAGVTDEAYFDILDGPTVVYSTNRFRLRILKSAHDGAQPAESWDNAVDALIARGDAAIAAEVADGQSRITSAITEFDGRQDQNDAAQEQNDLDQLRNNADQAINNQAAQGIISVVLASGQYDPTTRKPTITGEIGKIYLVPKTDATTSDHYLEWMWLNGAWEQIGTTETTIEGITTAEIDAVIDDEAPTGGHILHLTALSYLWAKLKDWATSTFTTGTIVNGKAITPSSVAATGAVSGSSVSDSVGSLADLRDSVSRKSGTITFTPYSDFTTLNVSSKSFGPLTVVSIEVRAASAQSAGQVKVGTVSGPFVQGLGAARIMVGSAAYEGVIQIAASGEVRFFSSTANATSFWGMVILFA